MLLDKQEWTVSATANSLKFCRSKRDKEKKSILMFTFKAVNMVSTCYFNWDSPANQELGHLLAGCVGFTSWLFDWEVSAAGQSRKQGNIMPFSLLGKYVVFWVTLHASRRTYTSLPRRSLKDSAACDALGLSPSSKAGKGFRARHLIRTFLCNNCKEVARYNPEKPGSHGGQTKANF